MPAAGMAKRLSYLKSFQRGIISNSLIELEESSTNQVPTHVADVLNRREEPHQQESEVFSDSLNQIPKPKPEKSNLFREVRQNFQKRLAEKISQTFSGYKFLGSEKNVWNCPKAKDDYVSEDVRKTVQSSSEMNFFDSIDNSLDIDKDDSLLINSSYYYNKSVENEAMAELDSLEVRLNQLD